MIFGLTALYMALAPAFGVEMNWLAFGYCVVAAMILVGIVSLCVSGIRALLRRSTAFFLVFTAASSLTTITAQKTNNVNNLPPQQMMAGGWVSQTGFPFPIPHSPFPIANPVQTTIAQTTVEDIARGWRIECVATNENLSYEMPTNAATVGNWHVHGAASSFGKNVVDFGVMRTSGTLVPTNWSFPLGTNGAEFSSFWYFVDGRIRPTPKDAECQICAVGVPMSAVPGQSRLWRLDGDGGSRVITWENFFLGGDINTPVNAQIELFETGDFVVRSNGVETVCRRVNPDDWDDDGIENEIDPNPLFCDGDFFGAANALSANANPDAYYWLDLSVTGALGVATVRVTCDGPSDLGDHMIIARTNQVCHIPLLAGAEYVVESGLPIDYSAVSSEYAEIVTNADNRLEVCLPLELSLERVQMRGGSDNYIGRTLPIDVGPRISDISGGCCACETNSVGFAWVCSDDCNCGGYWHDISAAATWDGYSRSFSWSGWCPCIWHEYKNPDDGGDQYGVSPRLVLDMPRTLFTNNNGGAEDSDIVRLSAGLFSSVPTNGTLTLDLGLGGFVNVWTASNRTGRVYPPITWNVADSACCEFYLEGAEEIQRGVDCVSLTWNDANDSPILSENIDFAVYSPNLNVVNNTLFDNGDLCNPAGIVTGTNACFALEFDSVAPPSSEIVWFIAEGNAQFVGGNTGERVRIASNVTGQRVKLRAQIDDCRSRPPEITAYVVEPIAVKLAVLIVGDNLGTYYARDDASVSNLVTGVNKYYEQIGVSFYLDSISYTNNERWLDISRNGRSCDLTKRRELVNSMQNTGGLEIYFVDKVADGVRANHDVYGIVMSKNAMSLTLAHEIGHAFGCADVYPCKKYQPQTHITDSTLSESHAPLDWNNGTGCRYYRASDNQEKLIERLLMCGDGNHGRYDLSSGSIYGFAADGGVGLVDVGFFRSGARRNVIIHR